MHTVLAYLDGSWTLLISTLIFGALVGSFLNVVIVRLPSGASIAWPPSHCPNCKAFIRPYNNIPVLSWVLLRGQCANCQQAIDLRYPVVETVTACLFAGCASRFGASAALPAAMAFTASLVVISFIDIDTWEIPDEIVLWGLPAAILCQPWVFNNPWWSGLLGAVAGMGILLVIRWVFFALRGIEAMGLGDVKLLGFIGGFLGVWSILPVMTLASVVGALAGGILILAHRSPQTASTPSTTDELPEEQEEPALSPPDQLRLGFIIRLMGRRYILGLPAAMRGRTYLRAGGMIGFRLGGARSGVELIGGLFHDVPGWGHFEGFCFGSPPKLWLGPVVGARLADVEAFGDEEDWAPPPTALPFGPFLALGAIAVLFFAPWFRLLF